MIKIEQVINGWILIDEYEDENGKKLEDKLVFSYDDECDEKTAHKNKINSFIELLFTLNEKVGISYSKHRDYNLNIECKKYE